MKKFGFTKKNINKVPKWKSVDYPFEDSSLITNIKIEKYVNKFWDEEVKNIDSNVYFFVIFKVYINNFESYKSVTHKYRACRKDRVKVIEYCIECWNDKSSEYKSSLCSSIAFTYREIPKELGHVDSNFPLLKNVNKKAVFSFGGYEYPTNMDYPSWGRTEKVDNNTILVSRPKSKLKYKIVSFKSHNKIEVIFNNNLNLSFTDYKDCFEDKKSFKRVFNNQEYIIIDGKIVYKSIKRKFNLIKKTKQTAYLTNQFITMDLETRKINGILEPYCISLYNGVKSWSFFITDFKSIKDMMQKAVKSIMIRKYTGQRVYLHNFSNFDSVFLMNTLHKLTDKTLRPNRRDGRLIDLKFNFDKYCLFFRDSYLLLPSSLRMLGKSFKVEQKGVFPHSYLNDNNVSLDFKGDVPGLKYFYNINCNSINIDNWSQIVEDIRDYYSFRRKYRENKTLWILKNEAIKYCEQDVITLHQVLKVYSEKLFDLFRIDIHKYPTIPSTAFGIYRSNFMGDAEIPIILGNYYNYFYEAYTGGSVDVYKPIAFNVFRYDVNSLYPFVMKNFPMPVGNPTYFEGNIDLKDKPFGIFKVKVTAPKEINIPLLQKREKINGHMTTIAPVGTWEWTYFSEELYNAAKYGYTFEVKNGFLFKKGNIFSDYIDIFYNMKEHSERGSLEYIIAKLFLNSLYGKTGMSPYIEKHEIVDSVREYQIINDDKYIVTDITPLDDDKYWLSYFHLSSKIDEPDEYVNVSVPIAIAITAYARIYMSQFKTMKDNKPSYSDTDSVDLEKELDPSLVGRKLGQMKLEHKFAIAIYLAVKVYGAISIKEDEHGKVILEIVKIKGCKEVISFEELKKLLIKDSTLKIEQEKWYKDYSKSTIAIKNDIYTLMVTSNKRILIYNSKGIFVDTKPFLIGEYSLIIYKPLKLIIYNPLTYNLVCKQLETLSLIKYNIINNNYYKLNKRILTNVIIFVKCNQKHIKLIAIKNVTLEKQGFYSLKSMLKILLPINILISISINITNVYILIDLL